MYDFQLKTGPKIGACKSAIAPTLVNILFLTVKTTILLQFLGVEISEFPHKLYELLPNWIGNLKKCCGTESNSNFWTKIAKIGLSVTGLKCSSSPYLDI